MQNKFKLNFVVYYGSFVYSMIESIDTIVVSYTKYGLECVILYFYGVVLFWKIYNRRNMYDS